MGNIIFIVVMVIIFMLIMCVPILFFFLVWLPNYRSVMERAKKIDPSVKTLSEANYVLTKDIAKGVGTDIKKEDKK